MSKFVTFKLSVSPGLRHLMLYFPAGITEEDREVVERLAQDANTSKLELIVFQTDVTGTQLELKFSLWANNETHKLFVDLLVRIAQALQAEVTIEATGKLAEAWRDALLEQL